MHATCLRCHRTIGTSGRESGRPRKEICYFSRRNFLCCYVIQGRRADETERRAVVAVVEAEVVAEAVARAPIARR